MKVSYENENRAKLICEFVNKNEHSFILEEMVSSLGEIRLAFSDNNSVSNDILYYKVSDLTHILRLDVGHSLLGRNEQIEIIQTLVNRYINLLKSYVENVLINEKKETSQLYKSHFLMMIGRFREQVLESVDIDGESLYNLLATNDDDDIHNKIQLFTMEHSLSDKNAQAEEKGLFRLVCAPYIEKKQMEQGSSRYRFNEEETNNKNSLEEEPDLLKSLTIPKMKTINNISQYKLQNNESKKDTKNYLNADNLNQYIEGLLETHLTHHIDELGKNGKIPKRKVYSKDGVTPNLLGSTNKTSDEVIQYDEDIREIENELTISQLIMISFLMYLRYEGRLEKKSGKGISEITRMHQVIVSPNSDIIVPDYFIRDLQKLIGKYAKETKLSDDTYNNNDSKLTKLIEAFLLSRFGLASLNDYNNLLVLFDDLQYNLKELLTHCGDHISLLGIDSLISKLIEAYNIWLDSVQSDDSSKDYELLYNEDIERLLSLLSIPDDKLNSLLDRSSNDSYIKQRFRSLL